MMASTCYACDGGDLRGIYRVERVPVHSCLMLDSRDEALRFSCGDVDLAFCQSCGFIQNRRYDSSLQACGVLASVRDPWRLCAATFT